MTTHQAMAQQPFSSSDTFIDLLLIDGDHTLRGVTYDYKHIGSCVKVGGYICFHDSFAGGTGFTEWEVADFLSLLRADLAECLTLECAQGFTILKKLQNSSGYSDIGEASRDNILALLSSTSSAHAEISRSIERLLREYRRVAEIRIRFLRKSSADLRRLNADLRRENALLRKELARARSENFTSTHNWNAQR